MKKLIIILIFASTGFSVNAQKTNEGIKLATLKYMLDNLSAENSDEYFSKKGYTFDGTHELNDGTILTHYQHTKSSKTLSLGVNNDVKKMAGLSSLNLADYLALLQEVKSNGFKYLKTVTSTYDNVTIFYSTKKYLISFYKGKNSSNKTTYLISLSYPE